MKIFNLGRLINFRRFNTIFHFFSCKLLFSSLFGGFGFTVIEHSLFIIIWCNRQVDFQRKFERGGPFCIFAIYQIYCSNLTKTLNLHYITLEYSRYIFTLTTMVRIRLYPKFFLNRLRYGFYQNIFFLNIFPQNSFICVSVLDILADY